MSSLEIVLACRGTEGVSFIHGPPKNSECEKFKRDASRSCRAVSFSKDGEYFSWANGNEVTVISLPSFENVCTIDKPRTSLLQFSPKGNLLATWEPYTSISENAQENANMHIWNTTTGQRLHSFIQKKQTNWCLQWTDEEELSARQGSNEIHFYEDNNFERYVKKLFTLKFVSFSLAPGPPPHHVGCYVPGVKGQPSYVKLYKYPYFEGNSTVIAQRSFFKADRVEYYWNSQGNALLVLTLADVDKTGSSYYGEQGIFYISIRGDTSKVMLGKDGPIYSVQWDKSGKEFCVVYGFMPAKATLYNHKCESVFDFGTGPRNAAIFNDIGTMLVLYGFGNLRGTIEVWNLKAKKQISSFTATDSTFISWSPNSEHILTATTSPRLRIGNGYRIWHYTSSLLYEKRLGEDVELFDILWKPFPEGTFKERPILYVPVEGIAPSEPQASKQVYRPPSARGKPASFKLHEDNELPSNMKDADGFTKQVSKNKKKKDARKAKKDHEKDSENDSTQEGSKISLTSVTDVELTGDPEKDKRIKNIKKKLDQITKLKEEQKSGKQLELNQLEKLKKETELAEELQSIYLS